MKGNVDITKLCYGCMTETEEEVCPKCGTKRGELQSEPHHLSMGSELHERYVVGKVLGEGGFGITYIGWDKSLEIQVAIKEYFPDGLVTREVGEKKGTVSVYTGEKSNTFDNGLQRFLNETRRLAKFRNSPGIVGVSDFFEENGTAYMVMDYVAGINLSTYLEKTGGKVEPEQALQMLTPVIRSLRDVHKEGIIHRDISPDNIMVQENGEVRLIDFGAARDFSDSKKSLSIILKPGYAPEEQYRTKGKQGPWTDVYALCATLYKMITGVTPEESMERMSGEEIKTPSELGVEVAPEVERAILAGMEIKADNRIQSMDDLLRVMNGEEPVNIPVAAVSSDNASASVKSGEKTEFIENNVDFEGLQKENPSQTKAPRSSRGFKKVGVVLLVLLAGGILVGGYTLVSRNMGTDSVAESTASPNETKYAQAKELQNKGEYQKAAALYKELGNYNDSQENYKRCLLEFGQREFYNHNYESAIGTLEEIKNYENARELLSEAYLEYGKELGNSGDYEKAIGVLQKSEKEEKKDEIKKCNYQMAMDLYQSNEKEKAAAIFKKLGKYEDSVNYYGKCLKKYWKKAYKSIVRTHQETCGSEDGFIEGGHQEGYNLYDIDKDGIPELIFNVWTGDTFSSRMIFTFDGKDAINIGDDLLQGGYTRAKKGNGIVIGKLDLTINDGEEPEYSGTIVEAKLKNGKFKQTVLFQGTCSWEEMMIRLGDDNEITEYALNDYSPLK